MSIETERMVKLRFPDGGFLWITEKRWRLFLQRLEAKYKV
jgi:hypothetical protein